MLLCCSMFTCVFVRVVCTLWFGASVFDIMSMCYEDVYV